MAKAGAQELMIRVYNRMMRSGTQRRYYGGSGFYNFGYWGAAASTQREASEALVDELLRAIPKKEGRILDVACGLGASTKRLMESFAPADIVAINISEAQVEQARERAPGCDVRVMDATRLDFPDQHFDAVICVEAAFHFNTRDAFLREALRVLKPGGAIVLSDILFRPFVRYFASTSVPPANLAPDIETYRRRFGDVGFTDIAIRDATDECLGGFRRNLSRWADEERRAGRMKTSRSIGVSFGARAIARYFGAICKTYLLIAARKPGA